MLAGPVAPTEERSIRTMAAPSVEHKLIDPPRKTKKEKSIRNMAAPHPPKNARPKYDRKYNRIMAVPTRMNFVHPDTEIAKLRRDPNGADEGLEGAIWQAEDVWVYNGRKQGDSLDTEGFELVQDEDIAEDIDFDDKNQVMDRLYPHCEQLLQEHLGRGVKVTAFDHNVRKQKDQQDTQKPVGLVHGDFTKTSAPRRLEQLSQAPKVNDVLRERLGDQPLLDPTVVQECLNGERRYALINVWRSTDVENPVESFPLACMDATQVSAKDLRVLEIHYSDRIGENFLATPNDEHRWTFFPQMLYTEALLIKQWDSFGDMAKGADRDSETSTFSIHSAFVDPMTSKNDPPRQSIEVRCVAIWDKEDSS